MAMNYTGFGQIGTPTAYLMSGGNIGGPNVFNFSSGRPQLSEAARGLGTTMLPSDAFSRQEVRRRQDVAQAIESGRPYVAAPTMYQMNQQGKYVDPLTGKSLGTISVNYAAGAWRNIRGEDMPTGGGYSPDIQLRRALEKRSNIAGPEASTYTPASSGGPQPAQGTSIPPVVPERSLGISSETPLSFTGFGRATGESAYRTPTIPQTVPSPLPRGTTETLTSFSGIPRFPFAGY